MLKPIRVLHCPETVGGNPQSLARAERKLGLTSRAIAFQANYLNYQSDEILLSEKAPRWQREVKRWQLLGRALKHFDIIHFNFGSSIMPQWSPLSPVHEERYSSLTRSLYSAYARLLELRDVWLLKQVGKGIIVTYQGDDARQGDFCLANFDISPAPEVGADYYRPETDAQKRRRITRFAQLADRVYALNPDLLHVLPSRAQFLPYAHIDLDEWPVVSQRNADLAVPVVLHAPSHRGVKGTRFVLDAVSRLQAEGVALEFILVEGLPQAEARTLYERADLLIDQLLCGWYGGLAVELMALGKPVMAYIRRDDLQFIPPQMREELPIINVTPTTIYDILKDWLTTRKRDLPRVGLQGRAYVERWHDPLKIAAMLQGEYKTIIAKSQRREPGQVMSA